MSIIFDNVLIILRWFSLKLFIELDILCGRYIGIIIYYSNYIIYTIASFYTQFYLSRKTVMLYYPYESLLVERQRYSCGDKQGRICPLYGSAQPRYPMPAGDEGAAPAGGARPAGLPRALL